MGSCNYSVVLPKTPEHIEVLQPYSVVFYVRGGTILLKYLFMGFSLLFMYCDVCSNMCIWQTVTEAAVPGNLEVVGWSGTTVKGMLQ